MAGTLKGKKVAILAGDMFERVELEEPRKALEDDGAMVEVVSTHDGEIKGFDHFDPANVVIVDHTVEEVSHHDYDALLIPGGVVGSRRRRQPGQEPQAGRHPGLQRADARAVRRRARRRRDALERITGPRRARRGPPLAIIVGWPRSRAFSTLRALPATPSPKHPPRARRCRGWTPCARGSSGSSGVQPGGSGISSRPPTS